MDQVVLLILINSHFTHGPYMGLESPTRHCGHRTYHCSVPKDCPTGHQRDAAPSRIQNIVILEALVFTCTYTILLYILHLELFGTVTVLFLIAVGQWRHHTNPGLASFYKLLQGLSHQVSSIK